MENENLFSQGNPIHVECLRYCFGPLIQEELANARQEWNEDRIRKQNCRNIVGGKPNELYDWPENFEATDCRKPVTLSTIKSLYSYTKKPELCLADFKTLVSLMPGIQCNKIPSTAEEAFDLYQNILLHINNLIE